MRLNDRLTGALAAAVLVVATSSAQAQCNTIGGKGTGGSLESARFQAYEAMLQGTDVGMWANWMVTGGQGRRGARLHGGRPQVSLCPRRHGPGVPGPRQVLQKGLRRRQSLSHRKESER
ncbi:MAG: hypothetical protein EHM67_17460 [Hyphomicrobiaceae bacterium]|nr:MAG: hypothetical protein EHM67_17460 [Hyphomicrobiaceae bacterium]